MRPMRLLFICLLFISYGTKAQLMDIIGGATDTIPCTQPCKTVTANYVQPLKTNTYQASSIPYNPISLTSPTTLNLLDDKFSGAVPIGFPFCFYTNQYTQLYISANGHITFNPNYALGNCSFDTKQGIPFYSATYPDNAIFSPFTDGNTSIGGTITYKTTGTAPFRKFVVQYTNIPFFGTACTGSPATFQCVLSETYNNIEIFITNKSTCNSDTANWLNYATLGIQNIGANNFLVVNNRNATVWSASNEGWKISPAGPSAYTLKWYNQGMLVGTNVSSISVCNPFPRRVTAILTLDCPAKVVIDTIDIYKISPKIDTVIVTKTSCKNTKTGTATVIASGGTPPYTYSLNSLPFVVGNVFTNLGFGNHYVQIKDANGCIATYSFFVGTTSTLGAVIDSARTPYCPLFNGALYGSGLNGVPPYTYAWSTNPSNTNSSLTGLGPGQYIFYVTDANGCKDSTTYTIQWDAASLPFVTDSLIKPVCGDSTGHIYLKVIRGTSPYNFAWSNAANTQNIHNVPSGPYSVTVSDANGCSITHNMVLFDTLNLNAYINNYAHTKCGLNNGVGTSIANSGLPPYSYLWSNAAITPSTNTLSSGWQYLTVTDANNCVRKDSVYLNPSVPLTIQFLPADAYCDDDNGVINTIVSGNTGPVGYTWNNTEVTPMIDSLAAGIYILTISDSLGCVLTDTVNLINKGKPKLLVLEYLKPLCNGDSTGRLLLGGLNGVAPYKYSFDGINFSAIALVTNFSAGTYKIYMRDANSCESDTTIYFEPPKPIDISLTGLDTLICYYDLTGPITFNAQDGTAPYRWSLNNINYQASSTFTDLSIGPNTIHVLDSNNCYNSQDIIVPGPAEPLKIITTVENVPCYLNDGGSIDAQITGGWAPYNYTWSHITSTSLLQNVPAAGVYTLGVIDDKGCKVDSVIRVDQNYCCDCYFPNAFTPNGDTKNDKFRAISPATDIERYELVVYNRWGQRVFKTNDINGYWDGTIKNDPAPIGTYFFKCTMKCINKKDDVFIKGDLILIR